VCVCVCPHPPPPSPVSPSGMKSRGVYETPGGTLLLTARRAMESITLDRGEAHMKVRSSSWEDAVAKGANGRDAGCGHVQHLQLAA